MSSQGSSRHGSQTYDRASINRKGRALEKLGQISLFHPWGYETQAPTLLQIYSIEWPKRQGVKNRYQESKQVSQNIRMHKLAPYQGFPVERL